MLLSQIDIFRNPLLSYFFSVEIFEQNLLACIESCINSHWDINKAESWTLTPDQIMLPQTNLPIINPHINSQHNVDNHNKENIIKSKQTPQKITEIIKNDQSLQTYTIDYMKLNELPNLKPSPFKQKF